MWFVFEVFNRHSLITYSSCCQHMTNIMYDSCVCCSYDCERFISFWAVQVNVDADTCAFPAIYFHSQKDVILYLIKSDGFCMHMWISHLTHNSGVNVELLTSITTLQWIVIHERYREAEWFLGILVEKSYIENYKMFNGPTTVQTYCHSHTTYLIQINKRINKFPWKC